MATYSSNTTLKISTGIATQATASRNSAGTTDVNVYTTPANSSAWVWVRADSGGPSGYSAELFLNAPYAPFPISLTGGVFTGGPQIFDLLYIGPSATLIARTNHPGPFGGTSSTIVRVVGTLMVNSP